MTHCIMADRLCTLPISIDRDSLAAKIAKYRKGFEVQQSKMAK